MNSQMEDENEIELMTNSPNDSRINKKWGFISALPSEYLIHFRNGLLNEKTSRQGGSCYKRPSDTVFIIPTSLKEIIFTARQLTKDSVAIKLKGSVVYRIYNPLCIYSLINFSDRAKGESKLGNMIGQICRSTSKALVSNMTVTETLTKAKDEIATALIKEASSVVAKSGKEWGVEIVTIDIHDVYLQDSDIFDAMQTEYKATKLRESKMIEMETQRDIELKELQISTELSSHRKDSEMAKAKIDAEIRMQKYEIEKQEQINQLQRDLEISEQRKHLEEKQFELDRYRVEQNEATANYKLQQNMERDRQNMLLDFEKNQKEVEASILINQEKIETLKKTIEAKNIISPVMIEEHFINALPSIAESISKSITKDAKINIFSNSEEGGMTPFHFLFTELMGMMETFKGKMSSLKEKDNRQSRQ
jgi:hypothetical protein